KRLSVHLLEPVNDIDTVEDLLAHDPQGDWKNPFVSVIIPVLNEEKRIKKVIESVKNVDAEIIVVDGGSNDRTAEQAERLGVKVVRSPKGRGVQMNAGALGSSGNNLLFLHADTILPEKYTHLVFKTLLDIKPVAGAFCFKTDMDNVLMRFIEYIANLRSRFLNLPYGDQGIFMSRASFERAGGYWEVPVAEDIFFIRNIKRFAKIKIVPENAVTSARRWKNSGILKTTFIHLIIMIGCYIGIDPEKLAAIRQMNEPD
ncbi:MAG: TIGR04283 family arsenosugar biosynthesis glycosyltransferase, partial [Deltaproteobacteria bacterium]|nr:TIGR04283 family arsenosugar biosynthesis glycosyltransferase [Deltaproteobacteria bacterium]